MKPNARSTEHKQVKAKLPNGTKIQVDEEMKSLLKEMWRRRIETNFSCQGTPYFVDQTNWHAKQYRGYIQMPRTAYSLNFIKVLTATYSGLYVGDSSFSVEFDQNPRGGERRISIRFTNAEIPALTAWAKKELY